MVAPTQIDTASQIETVLKQINQSLDSSFTNLKDLEGALSIYLTPKPGVDGCIGECDSKTIDMRSPLLKELVVIIDRISELNLRIDNLDSRVIN